ncbi:hypothetical protein D9M68_321670 [compost metagenome]
MYPIKTPKKLIEVALPLDKINTAAAREKSIRHGHPLRQDSCRRASRLPGFPRGTGRRHPCALNDQLADSDVGGGRLPSNG